MVLLAASICSLVSVLADVVSVGMMSSTCWVQVATRTLSVDAMQQEACSTECDTYRTMAVHSMTVAAPAVHRVHVSTPVPLCACCPAGASENLDVFAAAAALAEDKALAADVLSVEFVPQVCAHTAVAVVCSLYAIAAISTHASACVLAGVCSLRQ